MSPESILQSVFGYDRFKPLQREVIDRVLAGNDTLVVMPTGGGKSLCYQIPALLRDGLTVVVSPLIALMKDQVEQLQQRGVPAVFLNSSLQRAAYRDTVDLVRAGGARLLYVAPETLLMDRVLELVTSRNPHLFAIDEAHCISEWGHDFRPEYRQLARLREHFPNTTIAAFTATATPRVRDDIRASLGFADKSEFVASFNRENLFIEVVRKHDAYSQAEAFLRRYPNQSGIIYCFSRRQVDDLSLILESKGFSARPYHAGLDDDVRRSNQEAFIRDDVSIIVATIAFGMGINKPNVRFVLHFDLPKSIEGYYQEIGRAGRDGLPAHCQLLYNYSDVNKHRYFIDQKTGDERQHGLRHLDAIVRYAESEFGCRRVPLLRYFGEHPSAEKCTACDNCLGDGSELVDITIPAQKFLSCVKRTGERFGAGHVVDVLLGSSNEKVFSNKHNLVSTYGIGKDLQRDQWLHIGRQMVERGLLERDEEFNTLRLSSRGYELLRARAPILGVLQPRVVSTAKSASAKAVLPFDTELFELLRAKRKTIADAAGVPPYAVFSDRSLQEMAVDLPQTPEQFAEIHGVGSFKLERYAGEFLPVIIDYCRAHNIKRRNDTPAPSGSNAGRRYHVIGVAFNAGESIESLANRYQIQVASVLDHLSRFLGDGNALASTAGFDAFCTLSEADRERVLSAFDQHGTERLKPVYEEFSGAFTYEDLKVLRLVHRCRSANLESSKPAP